MSTGKNLVSPLMSKGMYVFTTPLINYIIIIIIIIIKCSVKISDR